MSITILEVVAVDVLPAASVAVTVTLCVPSGSIPVVTLQLPDPSAVVVYVAPFTVTETVLPGSAVPVSVGVVSFVVRFGTTGGVGAVTSGVSLSVFTNSTSATSLANKAL